MSFMNQGKLITFEGIDGAGKSTQLQLLRQSLEMADIAAVLTREPGGVDTAEAIREILLHQHGLEPVTELLLHSAARSEHVIKFIHPHLMAGTYVLCDRYVDSTMVYQGYGQGVPQEDIIALHHIGTGMLLPDLTFVLQVPLEVARSRQTERMGPKDRYETESDLFYARLHQGFALLPTLFPERCYAIDATDTIEATHQKIVSYMNIKLGLDLLPVTHGEVSS